MTFVDQLSKMNWYPLNQQKMFITEDTKWRKRVAVWELSILSAEFSLILNPFFKREIQRGNKHINK